MAKQFQEKEVVKDQQKTNKIQIATWAKILAVITSLEKKLPINL